MIDAVEQRTVYSAPPAGAVVRRDRASSQRIEDDWLDRFHTAYVIEVQQWIEFLSNGRPAGLDAWDGYASLVATDPCIASLCSGSPQRVAKLDVPALYGDKGLGAFRPLGDVGAVIDRLESAGYGGWSVLEQDCVVETESPEGEGPIENIRKILKFLQAPRRTRVNVGKEIGEGSAGRVTAGDTRRTSETFHGAEGVLHDTVRCNTDLFHDAYTSELAHFVGCVRNGASPDCNGEDARSALETALASIEFVKSVRPVRPEEVEK